MRMLDCLRCGNQMSSMGEKKIQLGQTGVFLGDLPNILAGALEVEIYFCKSCGKLEFFAPARVTGTTDAESELPQKECPECGLFIDSDLSRCPCCGFAFKE